MYLSLTWRRTLRQHKQRYNGRCRTRWGARSVASCKGLHRSCNALGYICQSSTYQRSFYHNRRRLHPAGKGWKGQALVVSEKADHHQLVVLEKVLKGKVQMKVLLAHNSEELVLQPAQASMQTPSSLKNSSFSWSISYLFQFLITLKFALIQKLEHKIVIYRLEAINEYWSLWYPLDPFRNRLLL